MIKINLLPYRERAKKNVLKRQIILIAACFGVFILILFSLHLYTYFSIGTLEDDVKVSEEQLGKLTKVAGEIDVVRADKRLLEKKIEIIDNLEKSRMDVVLLLNEMTLTVPSGQVWLTQFVETGTTLRIDGIARDNLAIANFMKNLERSPYIKSVDLNASKQEKLSTSKVQKFSVSCSLKKG